MFGFMNSYKLFDANPSHVTVRVAKMRCSAFYVHRTAVALSIAPFVGVFGIFIATTILNHYSVTGGPPTKLVVVLTTIGFTVLLGLAVWLFVGFGNHFLHRALKIATSYQVVISPIVLTLLAIGTFVTYRYPIFGLSIAYALFVLQLIFFSLSAVFVRSQIVTFSALILFVLSSAFIGLTHFLGLWFTIPLYWFPVASLLFLQQDLLHTRPKLLSFIVLWGTMLSIVVCSVQFFLLLYSPRLLLETSIYFFEPTTYTYAFGIIVFNVATVLLLLLIGGLLSPAATRRLSIVGTAIFCVTYVYGIAFLVFAIWGGLAASNDDPRWRVVGVMVLALIFATLLFESPFVMKFVVFVRRNFRFYKSIT